MSLRRRSSASYALLIALHAWDPAAQAGCESPSVCSSPVPEADRRAHLQPDHFLETHPLSA
jgi:hypothetical protein